MLSSPESVSWKQPRKLSGPDILFCRRQNRGRKRLRNTLEVTQPESGCTGFMQLIEEGGGWRCRGKRPSTRGREENASSGEGAAGARATSTGKWPELLSGSLRTVGLSTRWMSDWRGFRSLFHRPGGQIPQGRLQRSIFSENSSMITSYISVNFGETTVLSAHTAPFLGGRTYIPKSSGEDGLMQIRL